MRYATPSWIDTDLIVGNGINSNFVALGDPYSLLADLTFNVNGTLSVTGNTKMTAGTLAAAVNG